MGADAGFASIIGLAVLVLLYFAQARETSSLREQAELAAQRVAQLENRLAHAAAQSAAAVKAAAAAPLPPGVQPPPAVSAAGLQAGLGTTPALSPAPPAGVAAPALSAATKLIPTPVPVGVAGLAAARMAGAGGATVAAGAAAPVGAGTAVPPVAALTSPSAPSTPPAMNQNPTPRPVTAAGGATGTNGIGEHPVIPPPVPPRQPVQIRSGGGSDRMLAELPGDSGSSSSDLTRVLTALAAVAVVAAIVIVLLSVTSGGSNNHNASKTPPASNAPSAGHHTGTAQLTPVNPATLSVSVLNGTAVYHLADAIATQLGADGFKQGTITNAATQTQPTTTVQYVPGDQRDAAAVARALKLSSSAVQPMSPSNQQLGCPQGSSCSVVVTVGADLASTQTQTTTTAP